MADLTAEKFLGDGARNLAKPESAETLRGLEVFMDMWGLEAYTPPEETEMRVREVVKAMVYAARMVQREGGQS